MQLIGMIDWLTLFLDASLLDRDSMMRCIKNADKILKINGVTGEKVWETSCREQISSDSHYITVSFGSRLKIEGSPARVIHSHNVFGSLDIQKCAKDMIAFVAEHYQIFIPRNLNNWSCSRIDINQNFDMGSLPQAQQVIDYLKPLKCGRQNTVTYDTACVWGEGSTLHSGKAYLKGPQLRKLVARGTAQVSDFELEKSDRLLRLEYSMRRGLIARIRKDLAKNWYEFTPDFLIAYHADYFSKFISTVEVVDMCNVEDQLLANVGSGDNQIPTEGQAKAAYTCYSLIRLNGLHIAKQSFTRPSWHRHIKNLSTIGLVAADLQPINVVPLLRRQIMLDQPVSSWDDIKLAQRA